MISAATGVQVIPSVPYLQAIGMEKEELVQALGVFFTVATLALGFNLTAAGLLTAATALPGAVAMAASFAGMFIGQAVRTRMQPEVFRRWFQIGDDLPRPLSRQQRACETESNIPEAAQESLRIPCEGIPRQAANLARLQHRDADAEIDEQPAEQRG